VTDLSILLTHRANITRAGVLSFLGNEVPGHKRLGLDAKETYGIFYSPEVLERAAKQFRTVPLVNGHTVFGDWEGDDRRVIGAVGNAKYEHPYITADIAVWANDALCNIHNGKRRELSIGYLCGYDMQAGFLASGHAFDGALERMTPNHVALVPVGRAGPQCAIRTR
jgi:uncharacterized protein